MYKLLFLLVYKIKASFNVEPMMFLLILNIHELFCNYTSSKNLSSSFWGWKGELEFHGKTNSFMKQTNKIYGFAIRLNEKLLLYNKDPHIRMNLGNRMPTENKFECLRNEVLYDDRTFREI